MKATRSRWLGAVAALPVLSLPTAGFAGDHALMLPALALPTTMVLAGGYATESLNDEPTPFLSDEDLPSRNPPLLEIGPKFLGTGNISDGFTLPTGAVWTPSLWVYGNFRTAFQAYENDNDETVSEWANRLDLFANLQLSGTERILFGVTPLHNRDTGAFSGRVFSPDSQEGYVDELNFEVDTLFFEGDLAEIFPRLDVFDSTKNDIGITFGRQNVIFGDGFIVNDNMDGFGLSKNNIRFKNNPNIVNWRTSIFVGLGGVHRGDNQRDRDAKFFGWFNQIDMTKTTYNFDVAYVTSDLTGDLLNVGVDATRRIGKTNATFRAAYSNAVDGVTPQSDTGLLLFMELSWVPKNTHDNLYLDGFFGIDNFTSAARGPLTGGPLGRTGLLFAAQGIGTFPAPLSNRANEAGGAALGYQKFSNDRRTQFTVEAGARFEYGDQIPALENEYGVGMRAQRALGNRTFLQFDAFVTKRDGDDVATGARMELQAKL